MGQRHNNKKKKTTEHHLSINAENPKQNIRKSNPETYKNNYIPRLSGIYSRYKRLIQHSKINYSNPPHQQTECLSITKHKNLQYLHRSL